GEGQSGSEEVSHALSQLDHRSADLHSRTRELDLSSAALERERRASLEADLRLSLDRDVLPLDLERLRGLERGLAGDLASPVLPELLLDVVGDLDMQLAAALDREVLLAVGVDLLVALERE